MQQGGRDCPCARIFHTHPAQCSPGEQTNQCIGHQQQEHIHLDGMIDVIEDSHGDFPAGERWPGKPHQLALERIPRQQQEIREKNHHHRLSDEYQNSHGTRPQECPDLERRVIDNHMPGLPGRLGLARLAPSPTR